MRPVENIGLGQKENLTTEVVVMERTARKCTETIIITIMMSDVLHAKPKQDSYVNLEVEEVIDPLFTLRETENKNK